MDEREAIDRLKRGDIRGLEILVRRHQLEAIRLVFPIVGDAGMAEEVVQDAFLRVYEHIHQFDADRPFRAWFLKIAVNGALKCLRRLQRFSALDEYPDAPNEEGSGTISLSFDQPEFGEAHDTEACFQVLLSALTPEHRAVLQLKYYLDLTDEEIAEVVQIPCGTVKSRLRLAKLRFRGLLQQSDVLALV